MTVGTNREERSELEVWVSFGTIIDLMKSVRHGPSPFMDALATGQIKARALNPPPATGDLILDSADPSSTVWWQRYNHRELAHPDLEQEWTEWLRNSVEVQHAPALRTFNCPVLPDQLTKAVWKPHKLRTILRQLTEWRTEARESRGAPKRYDDKAYIRHAPLLLCD
jgi:hypothetical protein